MRRRILAALVVAATTVAVVGLSPGAANAASGGGCTKSGYSGFSVTMCISIGWRNVLPDYYLNSLGAHSSQCLIYDILIGPSTENAVVNTASCVDWLRHFGPWAQDLRWQGGCYQNWVVLWDPGLSPALGISFDMSPKVCY